jgi:hypothetical protein
MLQSRRGFLIGAGAVLAFPGAVVMLSADAAMLASLSPEDRELVEQSMANHPGLSAQRALDVLIAFGM